MSDAIVTGFNDAATWDQVLGAITHNAAALLDETRSERLAFLQDDADREQAVGLGINEIKSLFGNFRCFAEVQAVVKRQIDVEYAKYEFVYAFQAANTVEDIRAVLERVQLLHNDRESIIQEWASSSDPAVKARADELANEVYTIVLRRIAARLGDGPYLDALAADMMSARQENGPFNNLDSLIQALDDATDATGSESILIPFNEAGDWQAMLTAIKNNASALIDPEHLAMFEQLSVDAAYEQAVALGMTEIRTLFGSFASPEQIARTLEKQIDLAHGRLSAVSAINSAQDAGSMAEALGLHIARLHQQRQELIDQWIDSGNPAAIARAIELMDEVYTTVLSKVRSHLGDEAYLAELAARMQSARQDGSFLHMGALIAALDMADRAIEATYDAAITGTNSGIMNEGDLHSVDGLLAVEDSDWGENRFKAVEESELRKQYGTFAFNSITGEWSFTLNSAAQSLKEGQQVHQTLTVASLDGSAATMITVIVIGQNDAPEAAQSGNTISGLEDTRIIGQVPAGTDIDGGSLAYTLVQPVLDLTFNGDGTFSYQPAANFSGPVTFQYQVVDANGAKSLPRTFAITISSANDRPYDISLSDTRIDENTTTGTVVGTLKGSDIDSDALTFSLLDDADGRFAISNGKLVVKDGVRLDHEQAPSHTLIVQAKDGFNAAYQETFVIHVNDELSESIIGSSSSDLLKGGSGSDTLWGSLGNDQLAGGSGKDIFVFETKPNKSTNKDKVTDFKVKDDSIWLDNKVFIKLGKSGSEKKPVQLNKDFFTIGSKAKDKYDYVIYDKAKGVLLYDADSSGKGKAVEIASLSKKLAMTSRDFFVV